MPAIDTSTEYTILDLLKGLDPEGNIARIINVLWTRGDLIKDGKWFEANDFSTHLFTQALSEPAGSFGVINVGVPYAAAKTKQVREELALLETYSRIDERILRKTRDAEGFRSKRNLMVVSGMSKTFNTTILYASAAVDPEKINGFLPRFPTLASLLAGPSGKSAGGAASGAVTSIYVIRWGEDGVFFVYQGRPQRDLRGGPGPATGPGQRHHGLHRGGQPLRDQLWPVHRGQQVLPESLQHHAHGRGQHLQRG